MRPRTRVVGLILASITLGYVLAVYVMEHEEAFQ